MIKNLLLVGFGGAAGSIFRYLISTIIYKEPLSVYPWATFTANMIGCFLIGVFFELLQKHLPLQPELRLLLITGFCGGLTTFSTFSAEGMSLMQAGYQATALLYIISSILTGLFFLWIGSFVIKLIVS